MPRASRSSWIDRDDARIGTAGIPEERARRQRLVDLRARRCSSSVTGEDEKAAHASPAPGLGSTRPARRTPSIEAAPYSRGAHRARAAPATPASARTSRSSSARAPTSRSSRCRSGTTTPCTSPATSRASAATSFLKHIVVSLGGKVVRVNPSTHLAEQGADVEALGLYFADAGQHLEQQVFVHHDAPHTKSRVTYKGALQGAGARTVWVGDVLIGPTADRHRQLRAEPQPRAHRGHPRRLDPEPRDRDRRHRGRRPRERDRPLRRRAAVLPAGPRHHAKTRPVASSCAASSPRSCRRSASPSSRRASGARSRPNCEGS